jgi:hypothetical protein
MKYLKLFEAFKSEILGSMMKFLSEEGKKTFLAKLKIIAEKIDLPLSEYSDEYFQYLPFKKALEFNVEGGEEGKIKLIKFWFDSKGDFITTTGVDGTIKDTQKGELDGYEKVKELTLDDILGYLSTGDIVSIVLEGSEPVISTVYREDNYVYMIQDKHNGSRPNSTDWKRFGKWSWMIEKGWDYSGTPWLLKKSEPKKEEKKDMSNPYSWNHYFKILNYGLYIDKDQDVEALIKKASFAIVLNSKDLTQSKFKGMSDIRGERNKEKLGATALMDDETIRKTNIDRYIQKLSDKVSIDPELKNLKSAIIKVCGGKKTLGIVIYGSLNSLRNFKDALYHFISGDSYYQRNLIESIKNSIKTNKSYGSDFDTKVENFKLDINKKARLNRQLNSHSLFPYELDSDSETIFQIADKSYNYDELVDGKPYLDFIQELVSVFDEFYRVILNKEINTFEDVEELYGKMHSIRNNWVDSPRFWNIRSIIERLVNSSVSDESIIQPVYDESLEKLYKELKIFRNMVIRFIS